MFTDVASVLGDIVHLGSFLVIIISIEKKKSCAGWSGRMQILILLIFISRYWKEVDDFTSLYLVLTRMVWILLSTYIVYLVYVKFKDTYEKKCDTFWIESIILTALASAFIFCDDVYYPEQIGWLFSHFSESLCILPQCYFVFVKHKKEIIVTYYVTALIYYRLLYIGHWFIIYFTKDYFNPFIVYPGLVQLFLYSTYFLLPRGVDTDDNEAAQTNIRRNLPAYLTQESLLETPLLKRSATYASSIYIIGDNCSDSSSINRSISDPGSDDTERY